MIFWLLACGGDALPDAADRETYAELVAEPAPDADRDLPRCLAIADPDLAGDCAMAVALRAGVRAKEPAKFCDRVPSGPWQFECSFQAAEELRKKTRRDDAIAACSRSGPFQDRCYFHLWQEDILRAQQGLSAEERAAVKPGTLDPAGHGLGADRIEEAVALGEPVYAEWSARFGPDWRASHGDLPMGVPMDDTSFAAVFWTRFFVQLFAMDPDPDAAACDRIGYPDYCRAAVKDVLFRRSLDAGHPGGPPPGKPRP